MNQDLSLHQRRRPPTPEEMGGIPWLALLQPAERERAVAALLVGEDADPRRLLEGMLALGPSTAVLKRGELGSIASEGGRVVESPALGVPVVDTVGAGDAFVAGFLAGRLKGDDLAGSLRLATAAGAFACLGSGDWESSPRSADLALLEGSEPVSR